MRIVVCVKEVLDPDAVNNYALAGKLTIGDDGKSITQAAVPALINAYDEQAVEAALRLRDAGLQCSITAVSVGRDPAQVLRHAAALGADAIAAISADTTLLDCPAIAQVLAAYVRQTGGADLILCGRQASDDDQGVVPAVLGEILDMPVITVAREVLVHPENGPARVRVTRVTPNGDETVEADLPAVVTVSSELGQPRYPTAARSIQARRMQPEVFTLDSLGLTAEALRPRAALVRQYVPAVQGSCEFIDGASPADVAANLVQRLRADRLIQ